MCGIAGFNWSDKNLIQTMTQTMSHRGPDDSGHYFDQSLSLGHRRLSILDLSSEGHQPMFDHDKEFVIVYNGEIYNFLELEKNLKLKGYKFRSKTDTEMILYAYKEWGPACLNRFIGMFAFAIYDIRKKKLFIARDHIGIKPLYYYHDQNRFIFCSTIPPILEHKIETKPNRKLIRDLLLYNNTDHTDETFFENIMKFPWGHYAIYDLEKNQLDIHKWWENSFSGEYSGSYGDAVIKMRNLMEISVNRRLISDVPVGTCLSGGVDSSSIACLINKSKRSEIRTFSAVFPGFKFDESKHINTVTSKTGMKNFQIRPTAETVKNDIFDFIRAIGEPVPGLGPYSQFKVFHLTRINDVTVLLDGQGADELLAGYHYFYGFYIKGLLKRGKIGKALKEIVQLVKGGHYKVGVLSIGFLLTPFFIRRFYFNRKSNVSKELLKDEQAQSSFFESYYKLGSLHDALKFHMDYKLEQLLKWEDRNSMAHSRESRVPFLDIDVMRFIFSLPEDFIISNGKTKMILKDAMRGIVPDEILERRDKIGFASPEDDWLREKQMTNILYDWFIKNEPLSKKYINLQKTRKMIKEQINYKKNHGRAIWRFVFLEAWLKIYQNKFKDFN